MSDLTYPQDDAAASYILRYIAEALEQRAMCLSCWHLWHGGCPETADGERPCCAHRAIDNLMAEGLTDDLVLMERAISRVEDLEAFLANSTEEGEKDREATEQQEKKGGV